MKKWSALIVLVVACSLLTVACGGGGGKSSGMSSPAKVEDKGTLRLSFRIDDDSTGTYKKHINDLWEKTKPVLREDAAANLTDEQLLQLGKEIKPAWVNLQAHGSLHHQPKLDNAEEDTKDHKLGNLTANVIGLIDDLYGWPAYTKEKREEVRANLRKGRLEYKIKEFDKILQSAAIN